MSHLSLWVTVVGRHWVTRTRLVLVDIGVRDVEGLGVPEDVGALVVVKGHDIGG